MYPECIGTSRSFEIVAGLLEFFSSVKFRPPPLEMQRELQDSFHNEAGKRTLLSGGGRESGALLELWQDPQCSSRVEMGVLENFLNCLKSEKEHFEAQDGRWDFSQDAAAKKGLISR